MSKVNEKQKNVLIQYLKSNPDLVSGKFSATFTYKDAEKKWTDISNTLNSIPGARKEWKSWRKTWQDMRSRTKTKYSKNKRNLMATGGGPFVEDPISAVDEEIITIVKPVCLDGHKGIAESAATIDLDRFQENETNQCDSISQVTINEQNIEVTQTPVTRLNQEENSTRVVAKRGGIKLRKTEKAVITYENMMKRKLDIKEAYYKQKIELLKVRNKIINQNGQTLTKISGMFENYLASLLR